MIWDEVIQPVIESKWGKKLSPVIFVFFLMSIIAGVIQIVFQWQQDFHLIHARPKAVVLSFQNKEDIQPILAIPKEHLFGEGVNAARLPITSLGIRLIGVIESDNPQQSTVIIAEGAQIGKVYHVGDIFLSNIKIHSIVSNGVILENAGHLEKLPLTRPLLSFEKLPKSLL